MISKRFFLIILSNGNRGVILKYVTWLGGLSKKRSLQLDSLWTSAVESAHSVEGIF
jgi:hypothetical protein